MRPRALRLDTAPAGHKNHPVPGGQSPVGDGNGDRQSVAGV